MWEGENSLKGAVLQKREPRTAPGMDVMKRVCGARNREVSIGLKECMDITNGRREVGNFKG